MSRLQPPFQCGCDQFCRILLHEVIGVGGRDNGGIRIIPVLGIVESIRVQGRVLQPMEDQNRYIKLRGRGRRGRISGGQEVRGDLSDCLHRAKVGALAAGQGPVGGVEVFESANQLHSHVSQTSDASIPGGPPGSCLRGSSLTTGRYPSTRRLHEACSSRTAGRLGLLARRE